MAKRWKSSGPMHDPAHPGFILRDNLEAAGWTITECARRLGVARNTLSRLLNERIGISPAMALRLEREIGWGGADFWVRYQAAYDLAQERLRQATRRRKPASARARPSRRTAASGRRRVATSRHRVAG